LHSLLQRGAWFDAEIPHPLPSAKLSKTPLSRTYFQKEPPGWDESPQAMKLKLLYFGSPFQPQMAAGSLGEPIVKGKAFIHY